MNDNFKPYAFMAGLALVAIFSGCYHALWCRYRADKIKKKIDLADYESVKVVLRTFLEKYEYWAEVAPYVAMGGTLSLPFFLYFEIHPELPMELMSQYPFLKLLLVGVLGALFIAVLTVIIGIGVALALNLMRYAGTQWFEFQNERRKNNIAAIDHVAVENLTKAKAVQSESAFKLTQLAAKTEQSNREESARARKTYDRVVVSGDGEA
jgi:hypothetical protein